jgi:hypothetical protein
MYIINSSACSELHGLEHYNIFVFSWASKFTLHPWWLKNKNLSHFFLVPKYLAEITQGFAITYLSRNNRKSDLKCSHFNALNFIFACGWNCLLQGKWTLYWSSCYRCQVRISAMPSVVTDARFVSLQCRQSLRMFYFLFLENYLEITLAQWDLDKLLTVYFSFRNHFVIIFIIQFPRPLWLAYHSPKHPTSRWM